MTSGQGQGAGRNRVRWAAPHQGQGRPRTGRDTRPDWDTGAGYDRGHDYSTGSTAGTPSCLASSQYGPSGSTSRATRKIARGSSPGGRST